MHVANTLEYNNIRQECVDVHCKTNVNINEILLLKDSTYCITITYKVLGTYFSF